MSADSAISLIKSLSPSKFLEYLTDPTLLSDLDAENWLLNDTIRHSIIKELDSIIMIYALRRDAKFVVGSNDEPLIRKHLSQFYHKRIDTANGAGLEGVYERNTSVNDTVIRSAFQDISPWLLLMKYLQVGNERIPSYQIENNLSWIQYHYTIQLLSYEYSGMLMEEKKLQFMSPNARSLNLEMINNHLAKIEELQFVHYRSTDAKPKKIKEIDVSMDNDVFDFFSGHNQDREYTGGVGIHVSTDYFKARWLNSRWLLLNGKPDRVLSYQSFGLVGAGYTPYIRYRNNFDIADSIYQVDRPFASTIAIERSKYRIWPKGLVRHHGTLQIGKIGTNVGRDLQALFHRDAITESQKVYGWDNQIANGGRWYAQLNHEFEFLLYSGSNDYKSVFMPRTRYMYGKKRVFRPNVIATTEAMYGGVMTAVGGGIKISSMNFMQQSGLNTIMPYKDSRYKCGFMIEGGLKYRYIIHNSTLEGFGYAKTFKDDAYDDEAVDTYVLNQDYYMEQNNILDDSYTYDRVPKSQDRLNRNMWYGYAKLALRLRYMTVYYKLTVLTKEYEDSDLDYASLSSLSTPEDKEWYDKKNVAELNQFRDLKTYSYGTIGVSWLIP